MQRLLRDGYEALPRTNHRGLQSCTRIAGDQPYAVQFPLHKTRSSLRQLSSASRKTAAEARTFWKPLVPSCSGAPK